MIEYIFSDGTIMNEITYLHWRLYIENRPIKYCYSYI